MTTTYAPTTTKVTFATRLRRLRHKRRWSQTELGVRANMTRNHIQYLERGGGEPNMNSLRRLAAAFHMTISQLLEGVA